MKNVMLSPNDIKDILNLFAGIDATQVFIRLLY